MKIFNLLILITLILFFLSSCNVFTKINESDWEESSSGNSSDNGEQQDDISYIYVVGGANNGTDFDFITLKYDSNGNFYESRTFDGGAYDIAYGVAVDSIGNCYVTGESVNTDVDYLTIKYNTNGNMEWQKTYDNGSINSAQGIAIDNNDFIYVTGYSNISGYVYYTIKYDQDGNIVTDVSTDNAANAESCYDITIDKQRNLIYLTGYGNRSTSNDYQTVKYDLDLIEITGESWPTWYPDPTNAVSETGTAVAVDSSGNVYVTGYVTSGTENYFTVKYDMYGNLVSGELWPREYDNGGTDRCFGIAVDSDNNIYVTGFSANANYDIYTIKYDSYGNQLWSRTYDNGLDDQAYGIAVDQQGYIYVIGTSYNSVPNMDFVIIKYDTNGNTVWVQRYDGGDNDQAKGICVFNK